MKNSGVRRFLRPLRPGVWLYSERDTFDAISYITLCCYEQGYKRLIVANVNGYTWQEFRSRYLREVTWLDRYPP